jgi:hypothetical protein
VSDGVIQRINRGRLHRAVQRITEWRRKNRHLPWKEQYQALRLYPMRGIRKCVQ